jgi:hypothetical protein
MDCISEIKSIEKKLEKLGIRSESKEDISTEDFLEMFSKK